jgi:hypothetical protein
MLGFYENFPENIHIAAYFRALASEKRVQQALARTLHELNNRALDLEDVVGPSVRQCTAIFEFGIAEANNFNYLDKKETNRILKSVDKRPFQIMDMFCAIRYYQTKDEKKTPLKFDYYILRFTFGKKSAEMRVFHERGPRHVSPKEITDFIANKTNETSSKKILKAFMTA